MRNVILLCLLVFLSVSSSIDSQNDVISSSSSSSVSINKKLNRTKRGFKFWSFFDTIGNMKRIIDEQYNDTVNSLNQVYDLLADTFSDTYTTTRAPPTTTTQLPSPSNETVTIRSTTEKYRISRYDLGVIGNRNLRGLKRLLRIELDDAFNQTKYNIRDYNREFKKSLATYATFDNNSINIIPSKTKY